MPIDTDTEPSLRSRLLILRRRKWWVIAASLIGLGGSLAWTFTATREYTATAQLLVQPNSSPSALGSAPQPVSPTQVLTELQLVTSAPVAAAVQRTLGSVPAVSAVELGQANVIGVSATAASPARAALVANTYAKAFVSYQQAVALRSLTAAEAQLRHQVSSLERQFNSLKGVAKLSPNASALLNQEAVLKEQLAQIQVSGVGSSGGVELVTPAQAPGSPSSPQPMQDALLGLLLGLIAGLAAAFLRENTDEALSSKEAVERWGEAPVLAMVPAVPSWKNRKNTFVVSLESPASQASEAYRSLRTSIQFAQQERESRLLLVTSPTAGDGKTSTVSNLGVVFAQAGQRVVLVSTDLRRPRIGHFFGVDERAGFTEVLRGELRLDQALHQVSSQENLWVLPAGSPPPNPAELLSGPEARDAFAALREMFDLVVLDSPPVLPVTDAVVMSQEADAALLVVAAGQTRRGDLQRAAEKLAQAKAPVIGIALNAVSKQVGYGYGYGHGYGYKPYASAIREAAPHSGGRPLAPKVSSGAGDRDPDRG